MCQHVCDVGPNAFVCAKCSWRRVAGQIVYVTEQRAAEEEKQQDEKEHAVKPKPRNLRNAPRWIYKPY